MHHVPRDSLIKSTSRIGVAHSPFSGACVIFKSLASAGAERHVGSQSYEARQAVLLVVLIGVTLGACVGTRLHRISKEEAKAVLTAFVNQEFERKSLEGAGLPREGRLAWPRLSGEEWKLLEFSMGRWVIATEPDPPGVAYLGFYVRASVDEFGGNPQLEAAKFYLP